jgi:hypothetical protein
MSKLVEAPHIPFFAFLRQKARAASFLAARRQLARSACTPGAQLPAFMSAAFQRESDANC